MTTWTDAAKAELERYFQRVQPGLARSGADAAEVIEDLRRHIDEEVRVANLSVVTEPDVRRLLARIGAPEPAATPEPGEAKPSDGSGTQPPGPPRSRPGVWLLILGVAIPVVTLLVEWVTGMCAAAFYDPIPSFWHVVLVAIVPLVNGLTWSALARGATRHRWLLGWANGFAFGVALFYALLSSPLLLPGLVAVVFYGLGLLPWAPTLALIAALVLRHRLRSLPGTEGTPLPGFWRGLGLAWLALVIIDAPVWLTRYGLQLAAVDDADARARGLRWLRAIGNDEVLLRACYGRTRMAERMDLVSLVFDGERSVGSEKAREVYYRVNGRAFNSVPAPAVRTGRGRWAGLDEWTWDTDQGGERVGGRVKGLFLTSSRLDAAIEANAAAAYTEWTLEFRNDSPRQAEARAQVLLPPGGAVSRLTLWINDEEREAAFGTRSQVRRAYQEVAVRRRRDPVLVTTCGPDRVLIQCFPVPPDGGRMRVRFGVTAPLMLHEPGAGTLRWPVFLERNFTLPESFRHSVWAESKGELGPAGKELHAEAPKPGQYALRGALNDLGLSLNPVHARRAPAVREVWAPDTFAQPEAVVRQTLKEAVATGVPSRVVVVMDGGAGAATSLPAVAEFLRRLPGDLEVAVLVAGDAVLAPGGGGFTSNGAEKNTVADELLRLNLSGGQDNVPALERAWDLAAERAGSVVLWVHGPQPVLLAPVDGLQQRYERRTDGPALLELQVGLGPNRLIEKLDGIPALHAVALVGSLSTTLERLAAGWKPGARTLVLERVRAPAGEMPSSVATNRVSAHIVRLWANDEAARLRAAPKNADAAVLAARYQLVTPVSGAVVLETQEQYRAHGLEPVDPVTVPSIPEPRTWALLGLGLVLLAGARWWGPQRWARSAR
jgi:hypothetical protein